MAAAVMRALSEGRPVVALESTIISHGLPRPRNLEVANELEQILRAEGVVPATVGVVGGQAIVGLGDADIETLAMAEGVAKASVRDLAPAIAAGGHAATTVAATAYLARSAGIRVFATGGIGGVHRGATTTFDESGDLPALARLAITVVCAGVKSVLDIGATLERLETLGITVAGYGTRAMPGFYVADSGFELDWSVAGPEEAARIMASSDALGRKSAFLLANPIPREHELDPKLHGELLTGALAAAEASGVHGKAVTPFLLAHIEKASGGRSLEANIFAVRNNVLVAAAVARAFCAMGSPAMPGLHNAGSPA